MTTLAPFTMERPAAGDGAWSSSIEEPPGATNDLAFTAEGDVIEAGWTLVGGKPRASLRRRSIVNGMTVWTEPTAVLWPELVGEVVAVASAPDSAIWVAANVGPANQTPRPRFVCVDSEGQPLGAFSEGVTGQRVFDVVVDAAGCAALGSSPAGDHTDGRVWLLDAENGVALSKSWAYSSGLNADSFDVVFEGAAFVGDELIVVGQAKGPHTMQDFETTRAVNVRLSRSTAELLAIPWEAPIAGEFTQSWLRSVSPDGHGGWVAVGEACDMDCSERRLEVGWYSPAGERIDLIRAETASWGNSAAVDSLGRVLVAATLVENELDAYLLAYEAESMEPVFDAFYPTGPGSVEEALASASDVYDRLIYAGCRRRIRVLADDVAPPGDERTGMIRRLQARGKHHPCAGRPVARGGLLDRAARIAEDAFADPVDARALADEILTAVVAAIVPPHGRRVGEQDVLVVAGELGLDDLVERGDALEVLRVQGLHREELRHDEQEVDLALDAAGGRPGEVRRAEVVAWP